MLKMIDLDGFDGRMDEMIQNSVQAGGMVLGFEDNRPALQVPRRLVPRRFRSHQYHNTVITCGGSLPFRGMPLERVLAYHFQLR
jgi:hypothetical protein